MGLGGNQFSRSDQDVPSIIIEPLNTLRSDQDNADASLSECFVEYLRFLMDSSGDLAENALTSQNSFLNDVETRAPLRSIRPDKRLSSL
jgi:hypothetical protein